MFGSRDLNTKDACVVLPNDPATPRGPKTVGGIVVDVPDIR